MKSRQKKQRISRNLEQWLTILSVTLISLVAFETIAVTTAMPFVVDILDGRHLYALAAGVALATQLMTTAIAGPWCDSKGPKPSLYTGIGLFVTGLTIATFAPNIEIVVIGRAIQGLGGGLMIVPLYVFVGNYVAPERQPRLFAWFSAAWVVPSLIGPFVAGFFVEHVNWRFVFGTVPLLITLIMPAMITQFRKFPALHARRPFGRHRRVIVFGALTGVAVAGIQVLSGVRGEDANIAVVAAVVVLTAAAFLCVRPLLPRGTLTGQPGLPATVLLRGILNGSYVAVEIFLPLILKEVHGWSPTQAGLVMTSGSITWALGSWIQGKLTNPQHRALIPILGIGGQLAGTALTIVSAFEQINPLLVLLGWLIAGLGVGLIYPALAVHALGITPPQQHGMTSSALSLSDTMGSALLVAWAGVVYSIALPLGHHAFAIVISGVCVIIAIGLAVSKRVRDVTPASLTNGGLDA
ncbi:MFS transporter [Trueperella bialowiezensis]|uniref:Probable multidrug-efflux transporter Rv1634/MT1670 n=1 Tax=Trueperella bialowiezensis TaxID=312285 RepID=A0A448PCD5_9ACTO|nr:MFS transporter [Trueperella bialowiezensis]VEI12467.1 Probable multidrug-efflux transporter Rv1634/MT1670 [Trueperella bialowiezensis]